GSLAAFSSPTLFGEAADALLGQSVESGYDLNGDGVSELFVSAVGMNGNNGQVLIVDPVKMKLGVDPIECRINAPTGSSVGSFGWQIAIINGSSLVVSASSVGKVFAFDLASISLPCNGNSPVPAHVVSGVASDSFGYSMANLGDIDGNIGDEIVIGSPEKDFPGLFPWLTDYNVGMVEVYSYSGVSGFTKVGTSINGNGTYDAQGNLIGSQSSAFASSFFGLSVAPAGDVNGSGVNGIIVGAPFRSSPGISNHGGADVFVYDSGAWKLFHRYEEGFDMQFASFGSAVQSFGIRDGSGENFHLVAGENASFTGVDNGAGAIFSAAPSGAGASQFQLTDLTSGFYWNSYFGHTAMALDLDGGGDLELLVAASAHFNSVELPRYRAFKAPSGLISGSANLQVQGPSCAGIEPGATPLALGATGNKVDYSTPISPMLDLIVTMGLPNQLIWCYYGILMQTPGSIPSTDNLATLDSTDTCTFNIALNPDLAT
ncbi:MAG: hypothetical protein KDD53_10770, partial [Bdellovibrionales bacterium]|nr:hypothetical protein [Bdellovibrionales bacterium]